MRPRSPSVYSSCTCLVGVGMMADGGFCAVAARGITPTRTRRRARWSDSSPRACSPLCGRACRLHGRADQRRPPLAPKSERGPFHMRLQSAADVTRSGACPLPTSPRK